MKETPQIIPLNKVLKPKINQFLIKHFSYGKAKFLIDHGEWLCKGNKNRFALILNDDVIGYFAIIPTSISSSGIKSKAIWWIDLVISKKHRGLGFQSIVDEYVRKRQEIKLGIPNQSAAKIHIKHKWLVRQDPRVFLYPINPKVSLSNKKYFIKLDFLIKMFELLITPIIKLHKFWINKYYVKWSKEIFQPSPEIFENVFFNNLNNSHITTWRDKNHFNHRYLNSPIIKDLRFYSSYRNNLLTHYCIVRTMRNNGNKMLRILDIYGDLNDSVTLTDLLKLVIKNALNDSISQITVLSTSNRMNKIYRHCGFIISSASRFCCYDNRQKNIKDFNGKIYLTLGDSDNDDYR